MLIGTLDPTQNSTAQIKECLVGATLVRVRDRNQCFAIYFCVAESEAIFAFVPTGVTLLPVASTTCFVECSSL